MNTHRSETLSKADCFWDYKTDSRITKDNFIERYCGWVTDEEVTAELCYNALCELAYNDEKPFIEIEKLSIELSKPTAIIPELLLNYSSKTQKSGKEHRCSLPD